MLSEAKHLVSQFGATRFFARSARSEWQVRTRRFEAKLR